MKTKFWSIFCAVVIALGTFLPYSSSPVNGQLLKPAQIEFKFPVDCPPQGPCQDEDGNWYMPAGAKAMMDATTSPKATGGPDEFGYTWDDSVPYNWADITPYTDTGLGYYYNQTAAIALPFNFSFYGITYSQVYIAGPGYLTFSNTSMDSQSEIPNPNEPNNVIAPYWAPNDLSSTGPTGRVYYVSGGSTPNRYFAVEWYQVYDQWGGVFTFEVLLYENGNILFQYNQMQSGASYWCNSGGIEDSQGLDGLAYIPWCSYPPSYDNKAVIFYKPAPSARVNLTPLYQGAFTHSNGMNQFVLTVRNNGELGTDTYDLAAVSAWPFLTLYAADGSTLLTDTDADGKLDTGAVPQGGSVDIVAKVPTPNGLSVGASNTASITATSSLNPAKAKTASLESTIPAPFAQVYDDINIFGINLDLNWPEKQTTFTSAYEFFQDLFYSPAIAETLDHTFINIWSHWQYWPYYECYGTVLEYSIVNQFGQQIKPVTPLTWLFQQSGFYQYDDMPAISVAPDGRMGITWARYSYNPENLYNANIWYAVLSPDGEIEVSPTNITNDANWYSNSNNGYYVPSIAVTADNRFMLAWDQRIYDNGSYLYDVYSTIIQSTGEMVAPVSKMTEGILGGGRFYYPSVTTLSDYRFLVAYRYYNPDPYESVIKYRVFDSNGVIVKAETSSGFMGYFIDGVQLSGGDILLASANGQVNYTVLDGTTLNPIGSFLALSHPASFDQNSAASVTSDNSNRAILTWKDDTTNNLYYALISDTGSVLSGPTIFRTPAKQWSTPFISLSYGNGITTFSPPDGVDGAVSFETEPYDIVPGGTSVVHMTYGNQGASTATNPVLSLTLGTGLTYISDNSGITPGVVGNVVTWHLPDLAIMDFNRVWVTVSASSDTPLETICPLTLQLVSDQTDEDATDNMAVSNITVVAKIYLPSILR